MLGFFLIASTAAHAATAYRVTIIRNDGFKRPPLVGHVIADDENRRLIYDNQDEPFAEDVMMSTDGGKTVTALNTRLRTWFALVDQPAGLSPWMHVEIKDVKVSVAEEPSEAIAGYPVRKFVIHASYTTREDHSGTKVNRVHTMTEIIWTTDKLDGSLSFPIPRVTIGVGVVDAELRRKTASISGFLLRDVKTISRAYEGGAPSLEMMTTDVDDIRTVASPPATQFVKPPGYINQPPIIGAPGK